MRRGGGDYRYFVLGLRRDPLDALAAALLHPVVLQRHTADVSVAGEGDDDILFGDQVFVRDLADRVFNVGAALVAVVPSYLHQFVFDDGVKDQLA